VHKIAHATALPRRFLPVTLVISATLSGKMKSRIKYLRLLRPHQYVKNGFVLVGALFSHHWDAATLIAAGVAFVAFCAMASAGYIMNDILDAEADRQHPRKSRRPIVSGLVKVRKAWKLYTVLVAISFILAFMIGGLMPFLLLAYLLTNIAYSLWLKHMVILDVFLISAGFMWRLLAGTLGLGFEPSNWMMLCGFMLTLFLGFAKRRAELLMVESSGDASRARTRRVLGDYSPAMLEQYTAVTAACTIISYGLFSVSKGVMPGKATRAI